MTKSKSIELQLNQAIAFISGIGLLIALLSYIAIDSYFYKKSRIAEISTLTSVTAHTAIGAVSFYDEDAANTLLKSLQNYPAIIQAQILESDGVVLGKYGEEIISLMQLKELPLPFSGTYALFLHLEKQ